MLTSGQSAGLAPLRLNGGSNKTHALLPDSRAINKGGTNGLMKDQRGENYPRVLGGIIDIGAVEASIVQATNGTLTIYGSPNADGITIGRNAAGQDYVALDTEGRSEVAVNLVSASSVTIYGYEATMLFQLPRSSASQSLFTVETVMTPCAAEAVPTQFTAKQAMTLSAAAVAMILFRRRRR